MDWKVGSMHDLLIAALFVLFVASPALAAAMPMRERGERSGSPAKGVDFPAPSLPASR
jgi:hypothetical protein